MKWLFNENLLKLKKGKVYWEQGLNFKGILVTRLSSLIFLKVMDILDLSIRSKVSVPNHLKITRKTDLVLRLV